MLNAEKNKSGLRNLDLRQILSYRLPWAGRVSILHRVAGVLLFLALPFLLYLLELSLASEWSYQTLRDLIQLPLVKISIVCLIWAYLHHFCAGMRCLLLDAHIGLGKQASRYSALLVLAVSLGLSLLLAVQLLV